MPTRYYCLICHNELPGPGEACPHCRKRVSATVGATPQLLVLLFACMVLFFVGTGFLNGAFRSQRRSRAQIHYQKAQTLSQYGYYADAIDEFRHALVYSRDNVEPRLGMALALYYLERFGEAQTHLIEIRADDPTLGIVNRLLARIAERNGEVDRAVSYYRTAIYGRWPQNPNENRLRCRFELVDLLERNGRSRQLIGELLELSDEAPESADANKRIGRLFLEAGAPDNAASVLRELRAEAPRDADVFSMLGDAEFALGNYLSARTAFRRALALTPADRSLQERLDLCERINRLDPTYRRLSLRGRHARTLELADRVLAAVDHCVNPLGENLSGPPAPLPAELSSWRDQALALNRMNRTGGPRRVTEESVEKNILLAESLWRARSEVCGEEFEPSDEPLLHVLRKLSR